MKSVPFAENPSQSRGATLQAASNPSDNKNAYISALRMVVVEDDDDIWFDEIRRTKARRAGGRGRTVLANALYWLGAMLSFLCLMALLFLLWNHLEGWEKIFPVLLYGAGFCYLVGRAAQGVVWPGENTPMPKIGGVQDSCWDTL